MLDLFKTRWELVLSASAFRWVSRPAWGPGPAQCVAQMDLDSPLQGADRLAALASFLASPPVRFRPVRVSLDDSWLYAAQVAPLQNAERWQDVQAYTAMRLQEVFELTQPLKVVMAPLQDAPYWACAVLQSDLQALRDLLWAQRLALASCVPQWSVVWNHVAGQLPEDEAVLLVQPQGSHLVLSRQGEVCAVRHWPLVLNSLPPGQCEDLLAQAFRRQGLSMPERLGWMGTGALPQVQGLQWHRLGDVADVLGVWRVQP
jgi:hypothetical protein